MYAEERKESEAMGVEIPVRETIAFPKEISADWYQMVRNTLKEFHISVSRLGMTLGVSRVHITDLLNGKRSIKKEMKDSIEDAVIRLNPNHALSLQIDYLRVRFPSDSERIAMDIAEEILEIPFSYFDKLGHGWNNYETVYQYGLDGGILLCESAKEELGILLEMTGQACRRMENHLELTERTWYELFRKIERCNGVYKRLDIAVNDHHGILDIHHMKLLLEDGSYVSRFRSYEFIRSGAIKREKEGSGDTLYVGSKDSEIYFCIYEKDYEQFVKYQIPVEEAYIKNRFEIRLFEERAASFAKSMRSCQKDEDGLERLCFGVINHYLAFLVKEEGKEKRNWVMDPMWNHFISQVHRDKIRLEMQPREQSVERSLYWVRHQCMPTIRSLHQKGKLLMEEELEKGKTNARLDRILDSEEEIRWQKAAKNYYEENLEEKLREEMEGSKKMGKQRRVEGDRN
ncbi:hypothetical protein FYJ34_06725 [Clostridiaceae bacterium 68-1-5]|uniref:Uncharacterized protein n=1 Tax=Suipraeoptans intestinalis TaxID=2606628 RepID=A0A6N7USZ4_9FIRM|nr:hypothetical protein [Suipraeoptans intestinalis]